MQFSLRRFMELANITRFSSNKNICVFFLCVSWACFVKNKRSTILLLSLLPQQLHLLSFYFDKMRSYMLLHTQRNNVWAVALFFGFLFYVGLQRLVKHTQNWWCSTREFLRKKGWLLKMLLLIEFAFIIAAVQLQVPGGIGTHDPPMVFIIPEMHPAYRLVCLITGRLSPAEFRSFFHPRVNKP